MVICVGNDANIEKYIFGIFLYQFFTIKVNQTKKPDHQKIFSSLTQLYTDVTPDKYFLTSFKEDHVSHLEINILVLKI